MSLLLRERSQCGFQSHGVCGEFLEDAWVGIPVSPGFPKSANNQNHLEAFLNTLRLKLSPRNSDQVYPQSQEVDFSSVSGRY